MHHGVYRLQEYGDGAPRVPSIAAYRGAYTVCQVFPVDMSDAAGRQEVKRREMIGSGGISPGPGLWRRPTKRIRGLQGRNPDVAVYNFVDSTVSHNRASDSC